MQLFRNGRAVDLHDGPVAAGGLAVDGPRHELLAGAALAGDEDGGRSRGGLVDGLAQAAHDGRGADELLGLDAQGAVLALEAPGLDGVSEREEDALALEGLFEEVEGAPAGGLDGGRHVGVAADHEDGHVVAALAQGFQELEAVHLGHLDVEHDGVGGALGYFGEGLGAVARLLHPVAFVLQDHVQAVADCGFVVDHQHGGAEAVTWSRHGSPQCNKERGRLLRAGLEPPEGFGLSLLSISVNGALTAPGPRRSWRRVDRGRRTAACTGGRRSPVWQS